jgi:hypothetical protein
MTLFRVKGGVATGSSDGRLVDAADAADPREAVQAVTDNGAVGRFSGQGQTRVDLVAVRRSISC